MLPFPGYPQTQFKKMLKSLKTIITKQPKRDSTQILLLKSQNLLKITPGIKSDLTPKTLSSLEHKMSELVSVFWKANKLPMGDNVRWYFNLMTVDGQEGFTVRANLCLPVFFESKSTRNWVNRDCLGRIWDSGGLHLAMHSEAFVPVNANAKIYEVGYADSGSPIGFLQSEVQPLPNRARLTQLDLVCGQLSCGTNGVRP